jgi:GNAT superfamily N-acetyltransferase
VRAVEATASEGDPSAMEMAPVVHESAEEQIGLTRLSAAKKKEIVDVLKHGSYIKWVIEEGKSLHGNAAVISQMPKGLALLEWKTGGKEIEINVFVVKKYRKQGVGSDLVKEAKRFADKKKMKLVAAGGSNELTTDRAEKFYRANGVEVIGIRRLREGGVETAVCEVAPVIHEGSESAPAPVVHEGHIPWRKVERDPHAHEADMKLAERYGVISSTEKVYELVGPQFAKEDQEVFIVIPLNLRGELKAAPYEIARGQRSRVNVGLSDIMRAVNRAVLDSGCEGFIVVHNHPTGKCNPSQADRQLTAQIKKAAMVYGSEVKFLDHVVVGTKQCFSICENKLYKF